MKAVEAVVVGSETLFRKELSISDLISRMSLVREYLRKSVNHNIFVTTADVGGPNYADELITAVDIILVNIYPFWVGKTRPILKYTLSNSVFFSGELRCEGCFCLPTENLERSEFESCWKNCRVWRDWLAHRRRDNWVCLVFYFDTRAINMRSSNFDF